jgi:hypothetical protein
MELYEFLRGTLAWTATIACLWPINVPWIALAFKVQQGSRPIDMENDEYWWRSIWASLVLALITAGFVFVDYLLADGAQFPPGPIHLIVYVAYVPVAVWILTLFFAMDDLLHGLSLFMIYLYLPTFVLFALNTALGWLNPRLRFWDWFLGWVDPWLKPIT